MENIEVELRGPLGENEHSLLLQYIQSSGVHTGTQKRLFFDLSDIIGINNRTLDVRAKVTNGKIQIVVKKGEKVTVASQKGNWIQVTGPDGFLHKNCIK